MFATTARFAAALLLACAGPTGCTATPVGAADAFGPTNSNTSAHTSTHTSTRAPGLEEPLLDELANVSASRASQQENTTTLAPAATSAAGNAPKEISDCCNGSESADITGGLVVAATLLLAALAIVYITTSGSSTSSTSASSSGGGSSSAAAGKPAPHTPAAAATNPRAASVTVTIPTGPPQQLTVVLDRIDASEGTSYGFGIGCEDRYRRRHYVTEVDAESPADGKLDVGDEIKAVNGDTTQSMTHEDVRRVIMGEARVTLDVVRCGMNRSSKAYAVSTGSVWGTGNADAADDVADDVAPDDYDLREVSNVSGMVPDNSHLHTNSETSTQVQYNNPYVLASVDGPTSPTKRTVRASLV